MENIYSIYSGEYSRMTGKVTSSFLNFLLTIYSMYQISLCCELKAGVTIQFYKIAQLEHNQLQSSQVGEDSLPRIPSADSHQKHLEI